MADVDLDAPESYRRLDPDDMYRRVRELPMQMEDGWRLASDLSLPSDYRDVSSVVITGMGGSAIGGSLLESYAAPELPVPVQVWRGYGLPGYIGADTLVIAVSYSGNTEETLSALRAAHDRGAKLLTVTTGGTAADLAGEWKIPVLSFQYEAQPRATIGYLFTPLVRLFEQLGFIGRQEDAFQEALDVARAVESQWGAERPTAENSAKQLAQWLHGRTVVIYGADYLAGVARRWKTQMNENAKTWAFYEEFSELNHNAIVGYRHPPAMNDVTAVVVLSGSHLPERIRVRMEVTGQLMDRYGVRWQTANAQGEGRLAQTFSLIALGDYASYYLALLNGVDPTEIDPINFLKDALARHH